MSTPGSMVIAGARPAAVTLCDSKVVAGVVLLRCWTSLIVKRSHRTSTESLYCGVNFDWVGWFGWWRMCGPALSAQDVRGGLFVKGRCGSGVGYVYRSHRKRIKNKAQRIGHLISVRMSERKDGSKREVGIVVVIAVPGWHLSRRRWQ